MSCASPLKAFQYIDTRTGELSGLCFKSDLDLRGFLSWRKDDPTIIKHLLPCGQCAECRSDRAHEWANRLTLEAELYPGQSWFLTLTYDDDHLPRTGRKVLDRETGVVGDLPVVDADDISRFMKTLRKRSARKYRFFGVTEYGDLSRRPHVHIILFGELPDLQTYRYGVDGAVLLPPNTYHSDLVEECWNKGLISVQEANSFAMSYVAGYAVKKLKGKLNQSYLAECKALGADPQPAESARMSRRPGIAGTWAQIHSSECESGTVAVPTPQGAFLAPVPRLFESRIDPDAVAAFKARRSAQGDARLSRIDQLRPSDYLERVIKIKADQKRKMKQKRSQKV